MAVLFVCSTQWRNFEWVVGVLSSEVNLPGSEADHSPALSA
jgi:hypothetical protein